MSCFIRHQLELIQQDTTSSKLYNTNQQISNPTEEFDHYTIEEYIQKTGHKLQSTIAKRQATQQQNNEPIHHFSITTQTPPTSTTTGPSLR